MSTPQVHGPRTPENILKLGFEAIDQELLGQIERTQPKLKGIPAQERQDVLAYIKDIQSGAKKASRKSIQHSNAVESVADKLHFQFQEALGTGKLSDVEVKKAAIQVAAAKAFANDIYHSTFSPGHQTGSRAVSTFKDELQMNRQDIKEFGV